MKVLITANKKWFNLDIKELLSYRDLFYYLAIRDIKVRYKQTAIGILWAFFVPIITMLVFTVFFGNSVGIDTEEIPYPIFVYVGLVFWTFFSQALTNASNSLITSQEMIRKIYFPRILLPAATIFVSVIDFLIAALILVVMMIYYQYTPDPVSIVIIPLLVLLTYLTSLGLGLLLSAINVKYRDVRYVIPFCIQMLLFLTPVIYPVSIVGEKYAWILRLNPMSGIIENARAFILGYGTVNWESLLMSIGVSSLLVIVGLIYFKKTERVFADVI